MRARTNLGNLTTSIKEIIHIVQLRKHQWIKARDLQEIQLRRLKAIISYAYDNTRYYHKLFIKLGIKPNDIKTVQDLQKIPVVTKDDVQSNFFDFISRGVNFDKCITTRTSGSTGIPLKVISDSKAVQYSAALIHYGFFECGLSPLDKFVEITAPPPAQVKIQKDDYRHGLLKVERISVFNPAKDILRMLERSRPDAVYTFPSIITCLLHGLKASDFKIDPKLIFSQGESLNQKCRELVRSTFGIEINDTYGSVEFNRLAFECNEHSGLHMITDCAVIEFLEDGENVSSGEEGEIVVTGLYNHAMPLIRYEIEDVGIPTSEKCACGRSWPLIKSIEGRTDDFLVLPSDRIISPRLINVIEYIDGIKKYQIIQEEKDKFVVKLVKAKSFTENTINEVEKQIKQGCLGEKINVDVYVVNEISAERSGKTRSVISKVTRRKNF